MDAIQLITGFLGGGFLGGIVVALINTHYSNRAAKKERQIKFLDDQIREFYGPLFCLIIQGEKLFELSRRVHDAYEKEYIQKKYSKDKITRDTLRSEEQATIDVMNAYVHRAEANRQKIMELFDTKYSFIDPDDIEVFQVFFEHHVRRETEFLSNGGLRTPLEVYDDLGDISLLPEVFIQRIKERFREKKDEYDKKMGARKSTPRKSPNENSA